jgi:hypothetical protein
VLRSSVPPTAEVQKSLITSVYKRSGKRKPRWVVDGSRPAGLPTNPPSSSPTAIASTVHLVLALTAQFGWDVRQFDVVQAYPLADCERTYYVHYPPGFSNYLMQKHGYMPFDPSLYLLRVDKNCYGDPPAGRLWYDKLSLQIIVEMGFVRSSVDRCLFVYAEIVDGVRAACTIVVYVDDLLLAGDAALVERFSAELNAAFPLTEGGDDYLGLEIAVDQVAGHVRVTQAAYATAVVSRHGYSTSHAVPTPMPTDFNPASHDAPPGASPDAAARLDFPSVLGEIGYLAHRTMPWLLYGYGVLSSVARPSAASPHAPTPAHFAGLARMLRFINSSPGGLLFRRSDMGFVINAVVDASHGREIHTTAKGFCKSRSAGACIAGGATVSAFSSIQKATALSTFEAELYALLAVVRVLLALRRVASFIIGATLPTSVVECDNTSVIDQLQRRDLKARSRHIRVHFGFVIDAIDSGEIIVVYIRSAVNPANTLTAAEDRDRFNRSRAALDGSASL